MDYLENRLAELYSSEYPEMSKGSGMRLKLTGEVVGSFKKKLKILSEAIEELNLDIRERERINQRVHEKIDIDRDSLSLPFPIIFRNQKNITYD